MPSNIMRRHGYLHNSQTGHIEQKVLSDNPDENKIYAVIVRCGHCGDGYFIPIMFTAKSKDIYTAIEAVKVNPRIQRQKKDAVLSAFEITALEQHFIESVNNHDPYLKGWCRNGDDQVLERRVYSDSEEYSSSKSHNKKLDGREIKVSDDYKPYYVLERFFAPYRQGDRIVFASRKINKDELLREFFYQNCIRFGIKKGNAFFLGLYYQQYGKNNDLGVEYYNGYMTFKESGKKWSVEVRPDAEIRLENKVREEEEQERLQKLEEEKFYSAKNKSKNSALDKFYRRQDKHKEMIGKKKPFEGDEPELSQPGE